MQRKTAKKEAWRPKCAGLRLVYDSALFFETFMDAVYVVRTTKYTLVKKKKRKPLRRSGLGMDMQNICAQFQGLSLKNDVDILTFVRKTCVVYVVACIYMVLG